MRTALMLAVVGALALAVLGSAASGPTYNRDVAPILDAKCASCHRIGGIAPVSLTTAAHAKTHAAGVVRMTRTGLMPPWVPRPHPPPPLRPGRPRPPAPPPPPPAPWGGNAGGSRRPSSRRARDGGKTAHPPALPRTVARDRRRAPASRGRDVPSRSLHAARTSRMRRAAASTTTTASSSTRS